MVIEPNNCYKKIDKYLNKITLGDSYELIKGLPDKSVDLIVTDPPYLIENTNAGGAVNLLNQYKV